jgi:predicted nucleotidyltransferase
LISSWATLAVLSAFAAAGWWLMGRLGWRSPASPAALLADLLEELRGLFGNELVGVYLYGSAVAGDFDPGRSDLDLVVVCGGEVEGRLAELEALHRDLVGAHPEWDDRVDVLYVPAAALREFRARSLPMAVISPGEPLHLTQTSPKWMMNWHLVREQGKALLGPPAASLIPATTPEDFVASVRAHLERWPEWIGASDRPAFRAYAVLTLCRALHALHLGRQASKREAARWAVREYPEWSELIGRALAWLDDKSADVPDPTPFLAFVRRDGGKLAS